MISLAEASALTGVSRSGLLKAIKTGRLSASRSSTASGFLVDPAELFRVYPAIAVPDAQNQAGSGAHTSAENAPAASESLARLADRCEHLEQVVSLLEDERNDLRRRLDQSETERTRVTHLLASPRTDAHSPIERPRTGVPGWFLGVAAASLAVLALGVLVFALSRTGFNLQ